MYILSSSVTSQAGLKCSEVGIEIIGALCALTCFFIPQVNALELLDAIEPFGPEFTEFDPDSMNTGWYVSFESFQVMVNVVCLRSCNAH